MRTIEFRLVALSTLLGSSLLTPMSLQAQTSVATDPVGFTTTGLQAYTDTFVSIPFTRPAAFTGAIAAISGSTITVASSPGWATDQYVYAAGVQSNTYYAIIGPLTAPVSGTVTVTNGSTAVTATMGLARIVTGDEIIVNGLAYNVASVASDTAITLSRAYTGATASGLAATFDHSPKEGSHYTITTNSANALTVNLNGDSLGLVTAGTSVSLIPYWTLGTAFPATDAGVSYIASTGPQPRNRHTQILFPDLVSTGIDFSPNAIFYNYRGVWTADGSTSANDTILPPANFFTVRNNSQATTFTSAGAVSMNRLIVPLDTQKFGAQDNAVALARPIATTLDDLGLFSSGAFAPSSGNAPRNRKDTLLFYDNTASGTDKSPSAVYYYLNNAWRLSGASDASVDYGSTLIPAGTGFKIRKATNSQGTTSFWQNTRNY